MVKTKIGTRFKATFLQNQKKFVRSYPYQIIVGFFFNYIATKLEMVDQFFRVSIIFIPTHPELEMTKTEFSVQSSFRRNLSAGFHFHDFSKQYLFFFFWTKTRRPIFIERQ